MAAKLRVGLVGCGSFSRAALIPAAALAPITFVCFCDLDGERAASAAALVSNARPYTSLKAMLAAEELDAVMMAVGPTAYPALVEQVFQADRDVFIEKPPALNAEQAQGMADSAGRAGRSLNVGFMKRFGTAYVMAKDIMQAPDFGPIKHISARLTSGVYRPVWAQHLTPETFLLDHSIHYLDLVTHFAGPVKSVTAHLTREGDDRFGFSILLAFANGASGLLELSNYESRGVSNERIDIKSASGAVTVDNVTRLTWRRGAPAMERDRRLDRAHDTIVWEPNMTAISPENNSLAHMGYVGELRHFAEGRLRGEKVKPDITDGIAALRLARAILASDGHPIFL